MLKKHLITLLLAVLLFCAVPVSSASAANSVRVTLPDFSVTLNGQTFSNDYSKYPFLVYKGITYFPMTFNDCRLMGIYIIWSESEGLYVEKNEAPLYDYTREVVTDKNQKTQTAQITAGKIVINGKDIDNSREQYPFLRFRGVTYFPLTWRFAVEEFGWDYHYDMENGLYISNPAVKLTCKETWEGSVDSYGGLMGTGSMNLACMFDVSTYDGGRCPDFSVRLYNITGEDITILPSDFQWEYQLYQRINGQDELIYRKAVPFYSGEIPASHYAHWEIDDDYWFWYGTSHLSGTVRAVLTHPDYFYYQLAGATLSEPTETNDGYAVTFSQEFSVS